METIGCGVVGFSRCCRLEFAPLSVRGKSHALEVLAAARWSVLESQSGKQPHAVMMRRTGEKLFALLVDYYP